MSILLGNVHDWKRLNVRTNANFCMKWSKTFVVTLPFREQAPPFADGFSSWISYAPHPAGPHECPASIGYADARRWWSWPWRS